MKTQNVWNNYSDSLYFFILKKVKNKEVANDIFQETFFKIHKNISKLNDTKKVKAWIFQIARNEIANYYHKEADNTIKLASVENVEQQEYQHICCFDDFINELPNDYKQVIELVYVKGHTQNETAIILNISLANVKARIRRSKNMLKKRFNECCKYELDKNGLLIGEPNCAKCALV